MLKGLLREMYIKSGGKNIFHECGECRHLVSLKRSGRNTYKCLMSGDDGTPLTDWDKSAVACNLFDKRLVRVENEQIEGQMNIFDFLA